MIIFFTIIEKTVGFSIKKGGGRLMSEEKKRGFEKRLAAYAAAAAGVMALAPAADAAIQYSGQQNLTVNSSTTPVSVDINNDGQADFVFTYTTSGALGWLGMHVTSSGGIGGDDVMGEDNYHTDFAKLPSGYTISAAGGGFAWWGYASEPLAGNYSTAGMFNYDGAQGYLGVRFTSATCNTGSYHYGWIQWRTDTRATQGTVIDWAYEDQCDTAILAGAGAQQQQVSVPTLNEWGMLALISLLAGGGMLAMRRRQEA